MSGLHLSLLLVAILSVTVAAFPWTKVGTLAAISGCAYGLSCLKVVTTGNEVLIERFGRFHRRLSPGWHIIIRPIDWISYEATSREQVMDIPPQQCFTEDNAPLKADAVVFLKIHDTFRARYAVSDVKAAVLNLCLTQLREQIGKLTLDQTFSARDVMNKRLLTEMNGVCHTWGLEITRVEIQDLVPSHDILQAMELQLAADRQKRAAILKSEGERISQENNADGAAYALVADAKARRQSIEELAKAEAQRAITEAEGMQSAIHSLAKTIEESSGQKLSSKNTDAALQLMLMNRYMESQEKLASSENTKVLMFPTKDSIPITYGNIEHILTK